MTLDYLKEVCRARHADLGDYVKEEIQAIYDFAADEVQAGENEESEVELALDALDALDELTDNAGE